MRRLAASLVINCHLNPIAVFSIVPAMNKQAPHLSPGRRALIAFPHDRMGGAERVTRTVAEAALRSGRYDEVVLFVMSRGDTGTLSDLAKYPAAKFIFSKARRQRSGLIDLARICRKGPWDLAFSSFSDLNAAFSLMRRLGWLRVRRLVTRESTMVFERDFGWKTRLARGLYKFYGRQDLILCQTKRMAELLTKHTGGRFERITDVIPNPVSFTAANAMDIPPDETGLPPGPRIVWCGRLAPVKSPLRAIEALSLLHKGGKSDTSLVMIGDGPMREEIEAKAEALGLAGHVKLTGFLQQPFAIMRACDAGLITSDVEGFPNVILEMLCSGIAGIASTDCAGGLDEIPGVRLSQEKSPAALADTLASVLGNPEATSATGRFLEARHPMTFLDQLAGD